MKRRVAVLFFKLFLLGLPILLTLSGYLVWDPYMVLREYPSFGETDSVELNRDYVSTETYLRHRAAQHYDSFVMGNSRTIAFQTAEVQKHWPGASVFHYDASQESLYGIAGKVRLLSEVKEGQPVRHLLIVLDATLLKNAEDNSEHLLRKHPKVSGGSAFYFQVVFARAFLSPTFAVPYMARKIAGHPVKFLPNPFRETPIRVDPVSNGVSAPDRDKELAEHPDAYYRDKQDIFFTRGAEAGTPLPAVIHTEQQKLLDEIKLLLERKQTDVKIVVSPIYDQRRINPADLEALKKTFGTENVFDYSGVNLFTADFHNYYEASHYRPHVGAAILDEIYKR